MLNLPCLHLGSLRYARMATVVVLPAGSGAERTTECRLNITASEWNVEGMCSV